MEVETVAAQKLSTWGIPCGIVVGHFILSEPVETIFPAPPCVFMEWFTLKPSEGNLDSLIEGQSIDVFGYRAEAECIGRR